MILIFVHGWSVTNTNTYGELPEAVSREAARYNLDIDIRHIHLGRYISFHDEVEVRDIARAFDHALREQIPDNRNGERQFSCITHSTGGPVIRQWIDDYYDGGRALDRLPLRHLVMLAPANHGSPLARLGKQRVGRIKAWFNGIEPGQKVLDWLCIGSDGQWQLNQSFLEYDSVDKGFYPFVLSGQGIDRKFYDFINSYLDEKGSDGVVRASGANLNYRYVYLEQSDEEVERHTGTPAGTTRLAPRRSNFLRTTKTTAMGIFNDYSHSGSKMGIMRSTRARDAARARVVQEILRNLAVDSAAEYRRRVTELNDLTTQEQQKGKKQNDIDKYSQIVFWVHDDYGRSFLPDEYDLLLLAGRNYQPHKMPKGFLVDKQINAGTGRLVFYVNADTLLNLDDYPIGIRVIGRPQEGFSHYLPGEYRSEGATFDEIIQPNETTYVDITLKRQVDEEVFRLGPVSDKPKSFRKTKPSGNPVK